MIETYRGEALAWEADDLGHMNMRFYIERTEQARSNFLALLGLPSVFQTGALSTVISVQYHIKYLSEATPGTGLWVKTSIAVLDETEMVLEHHIFKNPNETLSATVVETLVHISARTRNPFPWPSRIVANAQPHIAALSEVAQPRNVDLSAPPKQLPFDHVSSLGMTTIGRGCFAPTDCDVFGAVRPFMFFGKVSDSVQHLDFAWPEIAFETKNNMSGALLEARCNIHKPVKSGQAYIICSGLIEANAHVRKLCHLMFDPVTGAPIMSFIGAGCLFNLQTRRLVKATPAWVETLRGHTIKV